MIVSIIEGFDRVGKTKIQEDLFDKEKVGGLYDKTFIYKPPYRGLDLKFNRNQAWILGYSVLDFICQSGMIHYPYHLLMDRHIASSYVYDRLYGDAENVTDDVVLEDLRLLGEFDRFSMYYVTHSSHRSAHYIYDNKNSGHTDKLDLFDSFADYWEFYEQSDALFNEFFSKFALEKNVIRLSSVSDADGRIINYL